MPGEIRFWFEPSADRIVLFFLALFGLFFAVRLLKALYQRSIRNLQEKKLRDRLERTGLVDRPEETVVRELIERYKVRPPDILLSSLQQFDQVATDEIERIEWERMDLTDRLDRIEFLYSIRMTAFAKDPSVGGLEAILGPVDIPIQQGAGPESGLEELEDLTAAPGSAENADPGEETPFDLEEETTLSEAEMTDLKTLLAFKEDFEEETEESSEAR